MCRRSRRALWRSDSRMLVATALAACERSVAVSVLEEESQVLLTELRERSRIAADGALEDEPLLVLQPQDALLHRVAHDEAHGADGLGLPQPVRAVDRLILGGGVPPRGDAARLERDEDEAHVGVLPEGAEHRLARRHRHAAVELDNLDPGAHQPVLHDVEERDELGEDDGLGGGVVCLHVVDFLEQRLDLGRGLEAREVEPAEDAAVQRLAHARAREVGAAGRRGGR
eukprot:6171890-Pleurochrysis_carterae.AAC.1